jgi:hypothetical protein
MLLGPSLQQVTYRVFGYEVRIEIEACAQSIRSFTAARRQDKPAVDTAGHENSKVELEVRHSQERGLLMGWRGRTGLAHLEPMHAVDGQRNSAYSWDYLFSLSLSLSVPPSPPPPPPPSVCLSVSCSGDNVFSVCQRTGVVRATIPHPNSN